ncbi:conserved hypothetical protein [Histoplasma capsulatum G186AR]|uniref:Uncharacterized protein n=2 Tax=Ajellomyces capsulatus TaxID=5037 RepID=C0NDS0_AJECG|nr:uncharacterized protein HCBG_02013 [Histoplasma capsulatum G186AR]EEH10368.1 conserved hypothetical protein [Histoplasma capsulatum G186AR]KAG5290657.1 hypothetical protein I7I52_07747 [Histoplasma capsulatum]QSS72585.1 hypothetical protein I7I50_00479 [Histoplasma capsulatum G186AR]
MAAASIAMQRSNQRSSLDLRGSCSASHGGRSEADGFSFRSSKARSIRFTPSDRDTTGAQNERPLIQCPSSIASPCSNGIARNDPAFHAAADELTPNINELSGIGDSIASAPSSYRKLRKAKSMFSTRKRAMKSSDSSYSPFRSSTCSDNPEMGHLSRATLRRSKSFFAAEIAQKPDSEKRTDSQNAAIQLAREQYLQELQQSKRNDGSASILSGRGRHQPRPFRKSLRSSSGWDAENETPVATQPIKPSVIYPSKTLRNSKSRIFSLSIKNGLKRIFGRSMAQEERYAPMVQRKHVLGFSDYISSESGGPASIGNRPASIRTMKSSDSFGTFSSRATSWTDSTATNITATRDAVSERNRLSIIQENGVPPDSTPSRLSFHYNDGYSVFRKPLYPGRSGNNAFNAVDSQRVYSALVRHIDESHRQDEGDRASRAGTVRGSIYSPSSSIYSHRPTNTIRHIPSEASMRTIRAIPPARGLSPSSRSQISVGSSYRREALAITPQEIAQRNENMSRYRSVESLHRSKSSLCQPSRQKRSEIPNPLVPPRFSSYEHAIDSDDDIESVIVSRPGDIARSCVSPSVYSRTTSGDTPRHFGSRRDLSFSESSDERGTVTILASERLPYKPNDSGGYTCSDSKIRGSAEWKSWMSSQMDLLDATPENYAKVQYVKSPNAHYREMTEIHGELKDGNPEASYTMPQTNESITAEPPEGPSSLGVDQRQPLVELKSFTQNNFSRPLRLSPDIPISISRPAVQNPSVVARSESAHSVHIAPDVDPERSTPTDAVLPRNASRSPSASLLAYEKPECLDLATLPVTPTRLPKAIQSTISLRNHSGKDSPTRRLSDPRKLAPTVNFSSVRNRRDNVRVTNENLRGSRVPTKSNLPELGDIHSTISSKRMVDIFLSQRRRQMGGAEKGTEHAFI